MLPPLHESPSCIYPWRYSSVPSSPLAPPSPYRLPRPAWQVVAIRDIIPPPNRADFQDVYIVYELMDTDLHQIIRSSQQLTEDHCQVHRIARS